LLTLENGTKEYDAEDFRQIARTNDDRVNREVLPAWAISHGMVVVRNWNGFSKSGSAMSGFMYDQGNTYESCGPQAALNGTNIHWAWYARSGLQ